MDAEAGARRSHHDVNPTAMAGSSADTCCIPGELRKRGVIFMFYARIYMGLKQMKFDFCEARAHRALLRT
jgi:hypothetical protein